MRIVLQTGPNDCGPAVLATLHNFFYKEKIGIPEVLTLCPALQNGLTVTDLETLGERVGLTIEGYSGSEKDVRAAASKGPVILLVNLAAEPHFIIVSRHRQGFYVHDTASGRVAVPSLSGIFCGVYLKVKKNGRKQVSVLSLGKEYKLSLTYLLLCTALNALAVAASIVGGKYLQLVIEQAISQQSVANLVSISGTFLLIYCLHTACGAVLALFRGRHLTRLYYVQMNEMMQKLQDKPLAFMSKVSRNDLLSIDKHCLSWNSHYVIGFTDLMGDFLVGSAAIIAIASIDYRFMLVTVAALLCQGLVAWFQWSWQRGKAGPNKRIADEYKQLLLTFIGSKTNAVDSLQLKRLAGSVKRNLHEQIEAFKAHAVFEQGSTAATAILNHLTFLAAVTIGSVLIIDGGLSSIAQITYYLALIGLLKESGAGAVGWFVQRPLAKQAANFLKAVNLADCKKEETESGLAVPVREIFVRELSFAYGSRRIIAEFSAVLSKSTMISGRSGCGKSTLARVIARDCLPSSGSVAYITADGTEQPGYPRDKIAVITHEPVFDESPHLLAARTADRLHGVIAGAIGVPSQARDFSRLSSGQRQVMKVMEFMDAKDMVLIFDEALSNVDPLVLHLVFQTVVKRICANNFVVWISHDHELARYFTNHVRMVGALE